MWESKSDEKWGPSVHDIEQFFSYGYYGDYGYHHNANTYDQQPYSTSYYQDNQYWNGVHSVQHGLSGLSVGDGNPSSNAVAEQLQVPYPATQHLQVSPNALQEHQQILYPAPASYPVGQFQAFNANQDWYYQPSSLNYYHGNTEEEETKKETEPSNHCSSPENQPCDGEDNSSSLEITDEPEPDAEVDKRLNKITPVAHTPKINGEIPSIDEASSDHERLLSRLEVYGFVESQVEGDGNCQFRALSDQLYHTSDLHKFVRRKVVMQLKSHPEMYEGYVPMAYTDYLKQISQSGEWGDHVTLQAAADAYGVKILVLTSFKDTFFIEIVPKALNSKRVIYLSYWAEVHYNSIYPGEELPPSGDEKKKKKKKKKKWWNFKNKPQVYLD